MVYLLTQNNPPEHAKTNVRKVAEPTPKSSKRKRASDGQSELLLTCNADEVGIVVSLEDLGLLAKRVKPGSLISRFLDQQKSCN